MDNPNINLFEKFSEKYLEEILMKNHGIFQINCKLPVRDKCALSLVYSPGVGASCKEIEKDIFKAEKLTNKSNSMIIVTDSSIENSVGKLNNYKETILPYLESMCIYYKMFANIDCYPIILDLAYLESEMDFVETLDAIMPAYSMVELFKVKSSKYQLLSEFVKNKTLDKKNYAVIGKYDKRKLDEQLKKCLNLENLKVILNKNLDYLNANFIYSCIIRAALDLKFYSLIDDCLDYILKIFKGIFDNEKLASSRICSTDKNLDLSNKEVNFINKNFSNFHSAMDFIICKSCEFFIANEKKINLIVNDEKQVKVLVDEIRKKFYDFSLIGKSSWIEEYPADYFQNQRSINENSILLHWRYRGVIETGFKFHIREPEIFSKLFSWENLDHISHIIELDKNKVNILTYKGNFGAIITNGTAILGFGDIGALAGLPVMEGKSVLFKLFGGLNIMPLCIQEKNPVKFISIVHKISPSFSAINLEDIKAPDCFEIESSLIQKLDYPVFHDDQHGTAIVVLSGIINSLKLAKKKIEEVKIVMNGAGAAGLSVCDLLLTYGAKNVIVCDTTGAIYTNRKKNMNEFKLKLALKTNLNSESGELKDVITKADIFIGVSAPKTLTSDMIKSMAQKPIIFALANPEPEIYPEEAYKAGAFIVATGRSDLKNQVNNSLAFPGIFRAAIDVKSPKISIEMKLSAGVAISELIKENELNHEYIIPDALDSRVPIAVAKAVAGSAIKFGFNQNKSIVSEQVEDNLSGWLLEEKLKNWSRIEKNAYNFSQGILKPKF